MKQRLNILNTLTEVLFPLCSYYLVNSIVVILGISYIESKKEVLSLVILGETAYTLCSCLVKMLAFLFSGIVAWSFYKKEKKLTTVCKEWEFNLKKSVFLVVLGAALGLALNIVWARLPWFQNNEAYEKVAENQYLYPVWLGILLYGLLSPWAEEVLFRGVLFLAFERSLGTIGGILMSSLFFGLFHGNLVQAIYGVVMGGIMAWFYNKFRHLGAPLLFHCAANVTVYLVQQLF